MLYGNVCYIIIDHLLKWCNRFLSQITVSSLSVLQYCAVTNTDFPVSSSLSRRYTFLLLLLDSLVLLCTLVYLSLQGLSLLLMRGCLNTMFFKRLKEYIVKSLSLKRTFTGDLIWPLLEYKIMPKHTTLRMSFNNSHSLYRINKRSVLVEMVRWMTTKCKAVILVYSKATETFAHRHTAPLPDTQTLSLNMYTFKCIFSRS